MSFADFYNNMVKLILERELTPEDGISLNQIEATEQRLGLRLPKALREYYRVAGNLDELNTNHNILLRLEQLKIEGDYLIFMEENQVVVLWSIKVADLCKDNPKVWQSVNETPRQWLSNFWDSSEGWEELSVSQFFHTMFLWTFGLDEEQESS